MTETPSVRVQITEVETTRSCGSCSACCSLLPVRELGKGAGERCKHQRFSSKGKCCTIYHRPSQGFPMSCALWNCKWLLNDGTEDLKRPDRSHYVLDCMPDYVVCDDPEHGRVEVEVCQIWIDPRYPDAHRDPALRAWLERRNLIGLVRFPDHSSIALLPPGRMADHQWHEKRSNLTTEAPHSFVDVVRAISAGYSGDRPNDDKR